jgi:hypothetical protein
MSKILREVRAQDPGEFVMGIPRFWFAAAQNDLMMLRGSRPKEAKDLKKKKEDPKSKEKNTKGPSRK